MPVFCMFCVYGSGGTADSAVVGLATAIELGSPQYFTLNQIDCDPSLRFDGGRIVFTSAGEGMSPLFAPGLGAKSSVYPPSLIPNPLPPPNPLVLHVLLAGHREHLVSLPNPLATFHTSARAVCRLQVKGSVDVNLSRQMVCQDE